MDGQRKESDRHGGQPVSRAEERGCQRTTAAACGGGSRVDSVGRHESGFGAMQGCSNHVMFISWLQAEKVLVFHQQKPWPAESQSFFPITQQVRNLSATDLNDAVGLLSPLLTLQDLNGESI